VASIGARESELPPGGLFAGEVHKTLAVGNCPIRFAVPQELARVDVNLLDDMATAGVMRVLLRGEMEPLTVGIGEVVLEDPTEGVVVLRRDNGLKESCHDTPTLSRRDVKGRAVKTRAAGTEAAKRE
jgi:hypothetical protein